MDLTEDKAKKILDFLAKKFGYDEFVLNGQQIGIIKKNDPQFIQFVALHATKTPDHCWIMSNGWYDFEQVEIDYSYAKCLKMMLAVAKKGYSITAYYNKNNFIKPYITLEELLITYDLETGYAMS